MVLNVVMIKQEKRTRDEIVSDVLAADVIDDSGEEQLDLDSYKDKMLDEALNELLPDGLLVANHRWLLDCNDPKVKMEALRMVYQLKGLLKQDGAVTINNVIGELASKSLGDLDKEIQEVEARLSGKVVEGEIISEDKENEALKQVVDNDKKD